MPVLKEYVGDMDSDAYKNAASVLDDDDNEQVATYIRVVIRAIGADEKIFEGVPGLATKANFDNSLTVRATNKRPID